MDSAALGIRNVEIFLETPIFFKNFEKFRPKRLDNPQDGIATIVSKIRGRLARDLEEFSLEMEDAPRNGRISNLVSEQSSQVSSLNQPANCARRYLKKSTKFSVKLDSIDEAEEEAVEIITRPQLLG
ncbi:hypothetical protein L5515_002525 [Caenorhabditis briggsae]|uniref:Uncharacterized protein n=1 Tax=Caenorhabditis briggsae TaxID=6238 RepID=A0AAE9J4D9_CAEBR|nr:hypothetical protein L5515_002525 [Caenorhabditis briggsae]